MIFKPRKRMKDKDEDEDEGDDDDGVQQEQEDEDEDMLNAVEKTRGSILITLRDVLPYTLWCVWLSHYIAMALVLTRVQQGCASTG
jgi:hypothetical protein